MMLSKKDLLLPLPEVEQGYTIKGPLYGLFINYFVNNYVSRKLYLIVKQNEIKT